MLKIIRIYWFQFLSYIIFSWIANLGIIFGSFFLSKVLNAAINLDKDLLILNIIIVSSLYIIGILFTYLSDILSAKMLMLFSIYLRKQITLKILSFTSEEFKEKSLGEYLSWYTNDIIQIQNKVFDNYLKLFNTVPQLIMAIVAIFLLHWSIGVFCIVFVFILLLVPKIFLRKIKTHAFNVSKNQEIFSQNVNDKLNGYNEFFNNNSIYKFDELINQYSTTLEHNKFKYQVKEVTQHSVVTTISIFGQFLAIFYTALLSINHQINYGAILSIASLAGTFFIASRESIVYVAIFLSNKNILHKFIYEGKVELVNKSKTSVIKITSIHVKNLSFNYHDKQIFSNFNFDIHENKKYLISAPSGTGKSTLLKILFGLIKNYQGQCLINEKYDYKKIDLHFLREQIAYISQESHLFNDTLRNNLTLYDQEVKEDKIIAVLQNVNLYDWYKNLNNGLDEIIEDKAKNISSGERQRLLIARGLLTNKKILFLDEPTANLDAKNAVKIEDMILSLKNITVLMVNHRIDSEIVKKYDEIISL